MEGIFPKDEHLLKGLQQWRKLLSKVEEVVLRNHLKTFFFRMDITSCRGFVSIALFVCFFQSSFPQSEDLDKDVNTR